MVEQVIPFSCCKTAVIFLISSLSRALSGLVVVTLNLVIVVGVGDLVTCIDIAAVKNIKKVAESEVVSCVRSPV
jgi:hypothetical protein